MFPAGTTSAQDAGSPAVNLGGIVVSEADSGAVSVYFELQRDGDLDENGSIIVDEYLLDAETTATIGDLYEAQLSKISGTDPTMTGGWSLGSYSDINTSLRATLSRLTSGTSSFTGNLTVREKTDTSNSATVLVSMEAEVL